MKNKAYLLLSLLCCSCNFLEKSKVSEEELVQQKMAEINLNEVDAYPLFNDCDENQSKDIQKQCFEQHITALFSQLIANQQFEVEEDIHDTLYIYLKVDREGKIFYEKSEKSNVLAHAFPKLDSILSAETALLPNIYPAKKRSIQVATKFKLPIIINSGN